MRILLAFSAALASAATGGTVEAKAVTAKDPSSIVKVLEESGYPARLTEDEAGDPMINSASAGTDFVIHFYGCTKNRDCSRVQFMVSRSDPRNASASRINKWNAENYFGRAYLTDDGAARLEMDVDLDDGGMSAALFNDNMQWWDSLVADFDRQFAAE